MSLNAGPLRKILDLEQKKGYLDSAVIGGLDRFLRNWSSQAAGAITDRRLLSQFRRLTKPNYASLTKEQRQDWGKKALDWLKSDQPEAHKDPAKKSAPTPARRPRLVVAASAAPTGR